MVRQAHHERKIKQLRSCSPFALSLSKGEWDLAEASTYSDDILSLSFIGVLSALVLFATEQYHKTP
jgi:hypothetical protein